MAAAMHDHSSAAVVTQPVLSNTLQVRVCDGMHACWIGGLLQGGYLICCRASVCTKITGCQAQEKYIVDRPC